MAKYGWKKGARISGNADLIGYALVELRDTVGVLTPEEVVRAAKAKKSPFHELIFDGTTAEEALAEYHLMRARELLRSIIIVDGPSEEVIVRAFPVVEIGGEQQYIDAESAADDPELRAQVRDSLKRRMAALSRQLRGWDEFAPVVVAIEEALAA